MIFRKDLCRTLPRKYVSRTLKHELKLYLTFLLLLSAEQDNERRLVKYNCCKWSCSGYTGHEIERERYNAYGFKGNVAAFARKSKEKNILKIFEKKSIFN